MLSCTKFTTSHTMGHNGPVRIANKLDAFPLT